MIKCWMIKYRQMPGIEGEKPAVQKFVQSPFSDNAPLFLNFNLFHANVIYFYLFDFRFQTFIIVRFKLTLLSKHLHQCNIA